MLVLSLPHSVGAHGKNVGKSKVVENKRCQA